MHTSAFAPTSRPELRYGLVAQPHGEDGFAVHDPWGIGKSVGLLRLAFEVAQRFDGAATIAEIEAALKIEHPGVMVPIDAITNLAAALDDALLLVSPRLRKLLDTPIRKPQCIGSYSGDPTKLREQLTRLFNTTGGPGMPGARRKAERLRAVLAPHMDYGRGGITYGHAFKELVETTDAGVFVIVGTSHYSPHRFTLSRQHFETPLGLVETDREYVDRIAAHYGEEVFDDPVAHYPEHAIELEVVLLKFLLADRPFKIVPLLTGPMYDRVENQADPAEVTDLAKMVAALRAAETACAEPVCYIISGDLAHIGPKFGDEEKAAGPWLEESRAKDADILKTLEIANPKEFFAGIAREQNVRRICGLWPAWLTLAVTQPRQGKVLHYQQFVHPQGHESVSFAAAAFYA